MIEDDKVIWKDHREEFGDKADLAKSFTFIPAKITDNKILLKKDPGYLGNLQAQSRVERAKLLDGNWDAEEKPGEFFQRQWFKTLPEAPVNLKKIVRYWDRAASEKETADWTVGLKMGLTHDDRIVVLNMIRFRGTPNKVEAAIVNTANQDGTKCSPCLEKDPGQAGVMEVQYLASKLSGFNVRIFSKTTDKATRARPISAQSEVGNVYVVEGSWNEDFFSELEAFPDGGHDDIVDTFSGGYDAILQNKVGTFTDTMTEDSETDRLGEW
jgi:predicted phage terminase large subunit-like protein